jgi:hypothetical protein
MQTSEQINEIAAACAKAQLALKPATKDAVNPAYKSRYADLASTIEAAKVYAAQGVAVWQDAMSTPDGVAVITRLAHTSGQWVELGPLVIPVGKRDAHGFGSATTYAKRYALAAALGISSDEDDDGNAAVAKTGAEVRTLQPVAPKGYREWLSDLQSVADNGEPELREAWKSSPKELREHLTRTAPESWDSIKLRAKVVTNGKTTAKVSA